MLDRFKVPEDLAIRVAPDDMREADGIPLMADGPVPDDFMMLPLGGTREIGSHCTAFRTILRSSIGSRASASHYTSVTDCEDFAHSGRILLGAQQRGVRRWNRLPLAKSRYTDAYKNRWPPVWGIVARFCRGSSWPGFNRPAEGRNL